MRPQRRSFKPKHYVFSALQSYKKVLPYVSRVLRLYGSQAWKQACLHWTCQSFRSVEDGHYTEEAEGHHLKDYFKHDRESPVAQSERSSTRWSGVTKIGRWPLHARLYARPDIFPLSQIRCRLYKKPFGWDHEMKSPVSCKSTELRSCVKVEVAVVGCTSLIVLIVSVDVEQHSTCIHVYAKMSHTHAKNHVVHIRVRWIMETLK